MRAYIRGEVEIWLPSGIYFHTDPVRQLQKISQQKVFVTAHGLPRDAVADGQRFTG